MKKTIKERIKSIVPDSLMEYRKKTIARRNLKKLYNFDKTRHKKYAYNLNDEYTLNNLRSKITFHYHSIEKGLSNADLRLGFGKAAFEGLFFAMDKYIEMGFPTDDIRFQQAISVIKQYVILHEERSFSVEWVAKKLEVYDQYFDIQNTNVGGFDILHLSDVPNYSEINFKELALNRHSIRDFGEEIVDDSKIYDAIQIATKTPSVCNRQAYRVYQIKNEDKLQQAYEMQSGLTTNGKNLQQFLLVTCNREFMNGPHERNQTYIDGGMFLMSLLYSLTHHQIATCALNTNFTLKKEKEMRQLLDVSESEDLIAFIAVGSFADKNKYAKSPRDTHEDITVIID